MMKINLLPPDQRCPVTICKPSRRFRRVGHSICGHKYVSDAKATRLVMRTMEEQSALIRAIENRLFKI